MRARSTLPALCSLANIPVASVAPAALARNSLYRGRAPRPGPDVLYGPRYDDRSALRAASNAISLRSVPSHSRAPPASSVGASVLRDGRGLPRSVGRGPRSLTV